MRKSAFLLTIILVFTTLTQAAEPVRRSWLRRLPEGVQLLGDISYVKDGHQRQRIDLYLPDKFEKLERPLPVVVWIHGGAWMAGDKRRCPAIWLAAKEKGYAVASVNYRLSQDAIFPAQIQDCKAALRWLRANAAKYHLNPDRIGVWGGSAGGHLVSLLGVTGGVKEFEGNGGNPKESTRVQAVVDWFGPSDLAALGAHERRVKQPLSKLLGGLVSENLDKARRASPLTYVDKKNKIPPFLIMQGDQDKLVDLSQSEQLAAALQKAGVEVQLEILKGAGHGGSAFKEPKRKKQIEAFFEKHLKKPTAKKKASAAPEHEKIGT